MKLKIATRKSPLALQQTQIVTHQLQALDAGLEIEWVELSTRGDEVLDRSLTSLGGKGLFTKTLEEALIKGEADLAVHSLKDMPAVLPEGFALWAVLERADSRDVLLSQSGKTLSELPEGFVLGTSSIRRALQAKRLRPDCIIKPLRGNVNTRMKKLESGAFNAIVMAAAGIHRLGYESRVTEYFDVDVMLPAAGQGALVIEGHASNEKAKALCQALNHPETERATHCERQFYAALGAQCQTPVAALAVCQDQSVCLQGAVGHEADGTWELMKKTAPIDAADTLGQQLAEALLEKADFWEPGTCVLS